MPEDKDVKLNISLRTAHLPMLGLLEDASKQFMSKIDRAMKECLIDAVKKITGEDLILEKNGKRVTIVTDEQCNTKYTVQWDGVTIGSMVITFPQVNWFGDDKDSVSMKGTIQFFTHG